MNSRTYLYTFIAIVAAFLMFIFGFFVLTPKDIEVSDDSLTGGEGCVGDNCFNGGDISAEQVSYAGLVRKASDEEETQLWTHQLEVSDSVVAYLVADDDKLKMVENLEVEIVGEKMRLTQGNIPLVRVSEVKF